ncbi:ssDNA-binding protein, mitochondrial [Hypocenomyce scalaris]|nr:ssDNA-binding protein, mitochondrial [Hypocenomyce scalaris]
MFPTLRPLQRAPFRNTLRAFSTTPIRPIAKITIVGRLAAEPEITATSTGQEMVRYAVGTSYGPKENRQTSWWRVASFAPEGPSRDHLTRLEKGTLVYIEGDCSMRSFENSEGKTQSALSIVQRGFLLLLAIPFKLERLAGEKFSVLTGIDIAEKIEVLKRPEPKTEAPPM